MGLTQVIIAGVIQNIGIFIPNIGIFIPSIGKFLEKLPSIRAVDLQLIPYLTNNPNLTFNLDLPPGAEWHGPNAISTANPSVTNNTVHQSLFCEQPSYDLS